MTNLQKYRKNLLVKAVIIPLAVTAVITGLFFAFLPAVEQRLPNAQQYAQQSLQQESVLNE